MGLAIFNSMTTHNVELQILHYISLLHATYGLGHSLSDLLFIFSYTPGSAQENGFDCGIFIC